MQGIEPWIFALFQRKIRRNRRATPFHWATRPVSTEKRNIVSLVPDPKMQIKARASLASAISQASSPAPGDLSDRRIFKLDILRNYIPLVYYRNKLWKSALEVGHHNKRQESTTTPLVKVVLLILPSSLEHSSLLL